ncbi:MAG TPA: pitrilysin family protein [Chloroflexota bacterium]|nr:pitrilysin family protein [Chloroflexota bacterium]
MSNATDNELALPYRRSVLPNGLRLITTPVPHVRSVSISIFLGAGARYEPERIAGISHFVEHMLFKGTERRPTPKEISEAIEGIGGVLNAATDKELTVYWCKVPAQHFDLAMDVLCDNLLNSKVRQEDVEREREVIIEELNMVYDSPADMANLMIDEAVWPNHPLGRDTGGTKESVSGITRSDLLDYMGTHYAPGGTVVAVAGQVTVEQAEDSVRRHLGGWSNSASMQFFPVEDKQNSPRILLKSKRTEQTNLCLAVPGVPSEHPDRYILDVMNTILGEGMSSRLFLQIRENLGLAYDVHSYVNHFRDTGSHVVFAGVDHKKAGQTITSALQELAKMKDGVPEEELARAKESMKGRLLLRLEDTHSISSWTGSQELMRDDILSVEEVVRQLDRVTNDDIRRLARELYVREKLSLAVVGPFRSEEKLLKLLEF